MGNCNDTSEGGDFDDSPAIRGSDSFTNSGVLLSKNLNSIITQERENLNMTGYPTDRGSDSWLVLSAGKGLDPEMLTRLYLIYSFYI